MIFKYKIKKEDNFFLFVVPSPKLEISHDQYFLSARFSIGRNKKRAFFEYTSTANRGYPRICPNDIEFLR